jgi:ankyrin repeat protein
MDTSLQDLLLSGDLEALKARLRPEDMSLRDGNDATLLHWAARGGHVPVIEWLLSQGLSPNEQDQNGETPLHVAVRHGHTQAVSALLKGRSGP